MALEYPDGPFVQNALVFAPGKTIIESLRELAGRCPTIACLPPRLYKPFAASVKLIFTRDGEKDIPVVRGSLFNVIVTNTEKIRHPEGDRPPGDLGGLFSLAGGRTQAARRSRTFASRRIASLPHLAVFSDEAHHTYGQSLDTELKRVRKTVDYLAEKTKVVAVVNTTGHALLPAPAAQGRGGLVRALARDPRRHPQGRLGQHPGVRLRRTGRRVRRRTWSRTSSATTATCACRTAPRHGSPSTSRRRTTSRRLRPASTTALARGRAEPRRLPAQHLGVAEGRGGRLQPAERSRRAPPRHPAGQQGHRGLELPEPLRLRPGRRLRSSNNFVLQAATRCLRQVPGNVRKARIYLSSDNRADPGPPAPGDLRREHRRAGRGRRASCGPPGSYCESSTCRR